MRIRYAATLLATIVLVAGCSGSDNGPVTIVYQLPPGLVYDRVSGNFLGITCSDGPVDANGQTARVALGAYGPIRRPLDITIWRRQDVDSAISTSLAPTCSMTASIASVSRAMSRCAL